MINSLIASTSTLSGESYLQYLLPCIEELFDKTDTVLFVPYARPAGITHDQYTLIARKTFNFIGKKLVGLHEFENPQTAIQEAKGIFTGGGNTFLLVAQLYKHNLIPTLTHQLQSGIPYLGTSAGSNICGITMQTTNDMPIVYPPSFKTLGIVPFNINPHYQDSEKNAIHMGETRETRINEFHQFNTIPVIGLREGSWIKAKNNTAVLKGNLTARLFLPQKKRVELHPETDLNKLVLPQYLSNTK